MFKPELWQRHDEYRTIVITFGRRLSRNNPKYKFDSFDKERLKLLNINLDPVMEFISKFYSSAGRPAKNQAQILRPLSCSFYSLTGLTQRPALLHGLGMFFLPLYGRTVYIKNHADLRFHPRIPRDSEEYKDIYRQRTACERLNDRILNNSCLQHLKIRGRDHFSFWTMLIGICIHLDAQYKAACLYCA